MIRAMDLHPSPGSLAGRRALIVGASSGIGRATAQRLLRDGACVTLAARTESPLRQTADALGEDAKRGGGHVDWIACDASVAADVRRAVERAEQGGGLDIAVAIPGGGNYCPILAYDDDRFADEVAQNVRPQFLVLKYAGLAMVRSGGGSIVAISSTAAVMSSPYLSAYCAGKAAVDQMVRVAADELGELGVRVNAVRPGLTRTAATGALFEPPLFDRFLAEQPLKRGGEVEDIAGAVRFLAGPESSWVTGQCLTVDGGHTIRKFPDLTDLARRIAGEKVWNAVRRGELP
jgi:NAD(P)-dependent dehydrogenase (short-subunit alcohol dehydrogenase family)